MDKRFIHHKMSYNPNIHHRRSIRLKAYDYSRAGLYFVSICTNHREHVLGRLETGNILLSETGKIANTLWYEIPNHVPNVKLHEFVVMPNHVHGIIEITNPGNIVPVIGVGHVQPL